MSESTPYILPSGRIVAVHNDVARGRDYILCQLSNGSIVTASRNIALASDLATARSVMRRIVLYASRPVACDGIGSTPATTAEEEA